MRSVREVLTRADMDAQCYSGHSFEWEQRLQQPMEQFRILVVCAGPMGAVGCSVLDTFKDIRPVLTSLRNAA